MKEANVTVTQLRALADWLDSHRIPDGVSVIVGQGPSLALFCEDMGAVRAVRRLVGKVDKEDSYGGQMILRATGPAGVRIKIWLPSGTCEQVQVGTERRPVTVTTETGEFAEVPVYEWRCPESILAGEPEGSAA